jgi:hypothetical protein
MVLISIAVGSLQGNEDSEVEEDEEDEEEDDEENYYLHHLLHHHHHHPRTFPCLYVS